MTVRYCARTGVLLACCCLFSEDLASADSFTFSEITVPSLYEADAVGPINDAGTALLVTNIASFYSVSLYSTNSFTPSIFGGDCEAPVCYLGGEAINNNGQVVALQDHVDFSSQNDMLKAFLIGKTGTTEIKSPIFDSKDPNTWYVKVHGLNNAGQVLAQYSHYDPKSDPHIPRRVFDGSFIWDRGAIKTITDPLAAANGTFAFGINNQGTVTGSYEDKKSGLVDGFVSAGGLFHDLNVPSGTSTSPQYINDAGQIAGTYIDGNGIKQVFVYSNNVFTTLVLPGSGNPYLTGFNNKGEVIGFFNSVHGSSFSYSNGMYHVIKYPGAVDTVVFGLNNRGEITGDYLDNTGRHGPFLGFPVSETPEPTTFSLIAATVVGIGFYWTFKRKKTTPDSN